MRDSSLAAHHVAAGSLETAMRLLHRQIGVVNFAPLRPYFLAVASAAAPSLPSLPGLPPLRPALLAAGGTGGDDGQSVPLTAMTLQGLVSRLKGGYTVRLCLLPLCT